MSPRPWRDKPQPAVKPAGPLIPTKFMAVTTQRLTVVSLFFLLQGMKLMGRRTFYNLALFSGLDTLFVYFLPAFAIPRFNFKPKVVLIQAIMLVLLNYTLFISSAWLWNVLWLVAQPLLSIVGLSGDSRLKSYESNLISGKYVVDILPEASAKLTTIAPLCINTDKIDPVYLQLSLENTWPSAVQLSRANLGNTSSYEHVAYSKRDVARLPVDRKASQVYLPVTKPGAYYLDKLTDDRTGLRVKIHRERIVVPPCPSVELVSLTDPVLCESEEFSVEVRATGVTPLDVEIDGKWLKLGEALPEDAVGAVGEIISKKVGNQVKVTKLRDRLGSTSDVVKEVSVRKVAAPVVSVPSGQYLPDVGGGVNAQFQVSGDASDAPFTVVFRGPEQEDHTELVVKQPGTHNFLASKPGKYVVEAVHGKRCAGTGSGSFEVFVPPVASVDVKFDPVQDKCAGPTGVDAHLTLHGTGPFKVGYRTLKGSRVVGDHTQDFSGNQGTIRFRPKDVGEYHYQITYVQDKYRRIQLPAEVDTSYSTTQQITELPGAQFAPLRATKVCGGNRVTADVLVRGRGPFILKYSVDDDKVYTVSTGEAIDQDRVTLDLELEGGTHFIRLISLTDRNQCVTELPGTRTPDIYVQPHLPFTSWAQPGELKSAEPVEELLPLKIEHLNFPAKLVYERKFEGKASIHEVVLLGASDVVKVTTPGQYRLVSVDDGICRGSVDDESLVTISLYEKPRLELRDEAAALENICHDPKLPTRRKLNVVVHGESPFTVIHEYVDPQGYSHTATHQITNPELEIELDASMVGQYKHYLWAMDARYPDFQQSRYTSFKHDVHPLAEAFFNTRKKLAVCEMAALKQPLPIFLRGQAPFVVTVQIGKEKKSIDVARGSELDLRKYMNPFDTSGVQKLKILSVTDAHGCASVPDKSKQLTAVDLEVLPQPSLPAPSKLDYCVGDTVSFSVVTNANSDYSGKTQMKYMWGNKLQRAHISERSRKFEKLADSPRNVTVLSLTDSNGCAHEYADPVLVARIHPLPKSKITEEPHFSIYKGDQISLGFAFEGTAPFSFTYTRSVNGVVKERKEVKNIMESSYNMIVDEGGEYEITELRDKYCHSSR